MNSKAALVFNFVLVAVCLFGMIVSIQTNQIAMAVLNGVFFLLNLHGFVRGLQNRTKSSE